MREMHNLQTTICWRRWRRHNITTEKKITITSRILMLAMMPLLFVPIVNLTIAINPIRAETGKGTDIFKVIMTVFDVDESKGDVVAIVTVNNGKESRVKYLKTEAFKPVSPNLTSLVLTPRPDSHVGIIEFVATFPNVTVSAGDEYKACIVTTKDLGLLCKTGHNSPAPRPEFVDLSLNEITSDGEGRSDEVVTDSED
jgi:hypothetical protein